MTKIYRGDRTLDGIAVTVDGAPLDPAYRILRLSTLGFEWGYEGAASAQLALAIIADHSGDDTLALARHDAFMRLVVANFGNEWEISGADVDQILAQADRVSAPSKEAVL